MNPSSKILRAVLPRGKQHTDERKIREMGKH